VQLKKTFVLEGCFGVLGFEIELYARPKFKSCERNRQRAQKSIYFLKLSLAYLVYQKRRKAD